MRGKAQTAAVAHAVAGTCSAATDRKARFTVPISAKQSTRSWPIPVEVSDQPQSASPRTAAIIALARPASTYELDRRLEQRKILLVVGRIDPVDLYPFPRACHPAGLKRDDVVSRELELRRGGNGQSQSNPFAANAGKHPIGDEIGVEAADRFRGDARQFEKQSVELRLAAELGCVGGQEELALLVINGGNEKASNDSVADAFGMQGPKSTPASRPTPTVAVFDLTRE